MAFALADLWKILAIFVVVLGVVLVGLDRGGKLPGRVRDAKSDQITSACPSPAGRHCTASRSLTQIIGGEFDDVTIDANGSVIVHRTQPGPAVRRWQVAPEAYVSVSRFVRLLPTRTPPEPAPLLSTTPTSAAAWAASTGNYQGNGHIRQQVVCVGLHGVGDGPARRWPVSRFLHFNDSRYRCGPLSQPGPGGGATISGVERRPAHRR